MYAAKLTTMIESGGVEFRVLLFDKRSERDRLVRFVRTDSTRDFHVHWDERTTCEPMTMREARAFIGNDKPIFEHDGWASAYDYVPFVMYEDVVHSMGYARDRYTYAHCRWDGEKHYTTYEESDEYRRGW